jgi:ribosomal protein S18 acetylase RimI-like enzyme
MAAMQPEPLTIQDYDQILALWRSCPGMGLSGADNPESLERFLARNPGLSWVCREGGRVVATALCGHDGRRGFLYHVAVAPDRRGRGLARTLVGCCLEQLAREGIEKCHLFVYQDNQVGRTFWDARGWTLRGDLVVFSRDIPPPGAD